MNVLTATYVCSHGSMTLSGHILKGYLFCPVPWEGNRKHMHKGYSISRTSLHDALISSGHNSNAEAV